MRRIKHLWKILLAIVVATQLSACSKTVRWEEEVPLNTGEVIWVQRSGTYSFGYNAGSGHVGYSPDWKSTIEFTYKGKRYSHTSEAFIKLLAISPEGVPNLVADARGWGNQNKYPCVTPYYAQFKPDPSGSHWDWPDRIEPWLYGLPANLLVGLVAPSDDGKKLKPSDRERLNASVLAIGKHHRMIDPEFKPENCMRSN